MRVDVRLFARAREIAGAERLQVELPESARIADVRAALGEQVPALRPLLPALLAAVGTEYAGDQTPINPAAEIAFFPPVSGG